MRNSVILAVTAAALASSFLVPSDAFAAHRGFAHAAQASRSVHAAPTGSARTAGAGFHRSSGFQHPGKLRKGRQRTSFTQRRFGSANTAVGHPLPSATASPWPTGPWAIRHSDQYPAVQQARLQRPSSTPTSPRPARACIALDRRPHSANEHRRKEDPARRRNCPSPPIRPRVAPTRPGRQSPATASTTGKGGGPTTSSRRQIR